MSHTTVVLNTLRVKVTLKTELIVNCAPYYFDPVSLQLVNNALYHFSRHPEDWDKYCANQIELHYESPVGTTDIFSLGAVLHALGVCTQECVVKSNKKKTNKRSMITWMGLNTMR